MPDELARAARAVRRNAFAKYSKFKVGAALETKGGAIYTGCNVENATYGLTVCAERVAVLKAISDGAKPHTFSRIAICADTPAPTPPCGACRQILWEFCGDIEVLLLNLQGKQRTIRMADLLPEAFDDTYFL